MEITAVISTHGNPELTMDTVDSVRHYLTDQILLVVDEAGWNQFDTTNPTVAMLKGFYHNYHKAPYRNIMLGLMNAVKQHPNSDWYCYFEYDALMGSSMVKKDLITAEKQNVWLIGNDYRDKQDVKFPLIEKMLKTKFDEIVYLLGAVLFYHRNFIQKCLQENFFERFLCLLNDLPIGTFPGYTAWDLVEHMMPTLAKHWGGNVKQFAKWTHGQWGGPNPRRYPIRWQPELYPISEEYMQASIMHPIKNYHDPIREFHRKKRAK